jgi:hypothetical protein
MVFNHENNHVVLMRWKTDRLRKELNRPELYGCYESSRTGDKAQRLPYKSTLGKRLIMPFYFLVRSPIVFPVATYLATLYGCLYLLFTTVTDVFKNTYGWRTEISGLAYLGLGVGFIAGQIVFALASDRIISRLKQRNNNKYEPEMRLSTTIFFALFVPVSFF